MQFRRKIRKAEVIDMPERPNKNEFSKLERQVAKLISKHTGQKDVFFKIDGEEKYEIQRYYSTDDNESMWFINLGSVPFTESLMDYLADVICYINKAIELDSMSEKVMNDLKDVFESEPLFKVMK